jgi:hypothetical protein
VRHKCSDLGVNVEILDHCFRTYRDVEDPFAMVRELQFGEKQNEHVIWLIEIEAKHIGELVGVVPLRHKYVNVVSIFNSLLSLQRVVLHLAD